jgi:hypothetical protein
MTDRSELKESLDVLRDRIKRVGHDRDHLLEDIYKRLRDQ